MFACLQASGGAVSVKSFDFPWMSPEVMQRFSFDECKETRSWMVISQEGPGQFKTGGIGGLSGDSDKWRVWGCWQGHPCLSKLNGVSEGDSMCYVYHEQLQEWYPWGLRSNIGCFA